MIKEAKVVVIGSIGVGKSSITIRFVNNQFNDFLDSTLGAVFFEKVHNYGSGKSIKYQFWDTAGQEKYKAIARIYYKDSKVAVVVYDVNSRDSFNAMKAWIA
jgi:small GTP-binding protein